MRAPHLLRVDRAPEAFAALAAAAREAGLRFGWLELASPAPLPPVLADAAALGALRSVAVGEGQSAAVKPRAGEAVLEDLVRENFLGCRLVLVRPVEAVSLRGDLDVLPRLSPEAGGWRVEMPGGESRSYSTRALVDALGRPRPWAAPAR